MKTKDDFIALYEKAKSAGLVHTQKQFASFCGIAEATVSKIMNGVDKFLTDDLYGKMEYSIMKGATLQSKNDARTTNEGLSSKTVAALIEEMAAQRKTYDQQIRRSQDQIDRLITIIEGRGATARKAQ